MAGRIIVTGASDFVRGVRDVLPKGLIWTQEDARRLPRLLLGIGTTLSRYHNDIGGLWAEAFPGETTQMLPDWERVMGLPDCVYGNPTSLAGRRLALCGKLAARRGGQSRTYFEALARAMGATSVTCSDGPWPFVWTVTLPDNVVRLRAGSARAGQALVTWDELGARICSAFLKYKPRQTWIWWTD